MFRNTTDASRHALRPWLKRRAVPAAPAARSLWRLAAAAVVPVVVFTLLVPAAVSSTSSTTTTSATAETTVASSPLAFDMPSTATLRAKPRKVFAHYYPPFPVSLDNADPATDYYQRNYLNPDGEGGAHKAYGGWIRDRPIPRAPLGSTWRLEDAKNEVRQAVAAGIDGFAVDIMVIPPSTNWQPDVVRSIFKAAEAIDPGFKVMPELDMAGTVPSVSKTSIAAFIAELAASPAAYKIDGKLAFTAFLAERVTPSWYTELFTILRNSYGIEVVFIPTFLNTDASKDAFAPISAGWGDWGDRNPAWNDPSPTGNRRRRIAEAHAMGKMFMQPVSIQDQRMRDGIQDESNNTENLRKTWQIATEGGAELVQLPTWNDYTEGTQFAPTVRSGYSWLDLNAYYLATYKMGAPPAIVRDTVYLTHRIQPHAALPSYPQTLLMKLRGGSPFRDTVEALTFLTAPGTVSITVGTNTYSCAAPAGPGVCTVPLSPGTASAKVIRNATTVATVTSPNKITATPYVQDMHYVAASSGRQGTSGTTTTTTTTSPSADTTAPSAPSGVKALVSGSTVSLAWTASTDDVGVTQYDIHRSTTAGFLPSSTTLVGSATTAGFTNSSVPVGTWYYRVAARDAAGNWSGLSADAAAVIADTTTTDTTAPSLPTGLAAAVAGSSVALSWTASTDNVGVAQYDVHRGTTPTFSPTSSSVVSGVPGTSTTFTHSSVAPGTWYYRVAARDAAGNWTALSAAATAVVGDTTVPSAPSGLSASVSGANVALSWTASTDNVGVTQYDVHRSTYADFSPSPLTLLANVSGTSFTNSSVATGTWYYRVTARDAAGNTSAVSAVAGAVVADTTAPTVPGGVTSTVSGLSATLSWQASGDNVGVTGYDVYRSVLSGFLPGSDSLVGSVTGTTFTYDALLGGTTYYRVVAKDAAGNRSNASSELAVTVSSPTILDSSAPSAPAVTALLSGSTVALSWTASTDNVGVVGYDIHRSSTAGFVPSSSTLVGNVTGTGFTNSFVPAGTWHYRVVARDAAGNSGVSAEASIKVADTVAPSTPSGLAIAGTSKKWSLKLSWTGSTDNLAVSGYDVYRSQSSGFSPSSSTLVASVAGSSFVDSSLSRGTWYYRVVAKDAAGNRSAASAQTSATFSSSGRL